MSTTAKNTSFVTLSAHEVRRLAARSMANIADARCKCVNKVREEIEAQSHMSLFGLFKMKRPISRSAAMNNNLKIMVAEQYRSNDYTTCVLLRNAAQFLLDDATLSEKQRIVHVSINDLRALT